MGSIGANKSNGLGLAETRRILGESADMRFDDSFVQALSTAELEYNEDGEIKFKFAGTNKQTGRFVFMEITAPDKKSAKNDIRANGYTVQRLYTSQVYDAVLNHSDGESWDFADATKIDNELLKRGGK